MDFTYASYTNFIKLVYEKGYKIASYDNFTKYNRCVILRHDVDYRLQSAVELARVEQEIDFKVKGTYFLLLTSDFYNVFSLNGMKMIDNILACGHEIGLHFDEMRYPDAVESNIAEKILEEADALAKAVGKPITKVSMHRPSKNILNANLRIPGMINTYSETFFQEFKYVSDSRRTWWEPIEEIVENRMYNRLHILIHPFWYHETEKGIEETVRGFINNANNERYQIMDENITNLAEIVGKTSTIPVM